MQVRTICRACHFVQHPGLANVMIAQGWLPSDYRKAMEKHFCTVNGYRRADYRRHLAEADAEFKKRMAVGTWTIDFGLYARWLEGIAA